MLRHAKQILSYFIKQTPKPQQHSGEEFVCGNDEVISKRSSEYLKAIFLEHEISYYQFSIKHNHIYSERQDCVRKM